MQVTSAANPKSRPRRLKDFLGVLLVLLLDLFLTNIGGICDYGIERRQIDWSFLSTGAGWESAEFLIWLEMKEVSSGYAGIVSLFVYFTGCQVQGG